MNIIKSSEEISLIFKKGYRIFLPDVNIIFKKSSSQHDLSGRVAFIAGKKQGNAVWRNRAKRRMRVLYSDISIKYGTLLKEYDILLIARYRFNSTSYESLYNQVEKGMKDFQKHIG